ESAARTSSSIRMKTTDRPRMLFEGGGRNERCLLASGAGLPPLGHLQAAAHGRPSSRDLAIGDRLAGDPGLGDLPTERPVAADPVAEEDRQVAVGDIYRVRDAPSLNGSTVEVGRRRPVADGDRQVIPASRLEAKCREIDEVSAIAREQDEPMAIRPELLDGE